MLPSQAANHSMKKTNPCLAFQWVRKKFHGASLYSQCITFFAGSTSKACPLPAQIQICFERTWDVLLAFRQTLRLIPRPCSKLSEPQIVVVIRWPEHLRILRWPEHLRVLRMNTEAKLRGFRKNAKSSTMYLERWKILNAHHGCHYMDAAFQLGSNDIAAARSGLHLKIWHFCSWRSKPLTIAPFFSLTLRHVCTLHPLYHPLNLIPIFR